MSSSYNTTQGNLKKKKCISASGFKGGVYNGGRAMAAIGWGKMLRDHIFNCKQEAEEENWKWRKVRNYFQCRTSPNKALSPITSLNMAFNRALSVQMQELTGDISRSNHHRLCSAYNFRGWCRFWSWQGSVTDAQNIYRKVSRVSSQT